MRKADLHSWKKDVMSGEVTADISERREEISGLVVEIVGKTLERKV